MEKRDYLPTMFSEEEIDIMQALRRAIDPKEIANRGKMFPGGEAPALKQQGMHPLEKARDHFSRVRGNASWDPVARDTNAIARDSERVHVRRQRQQDRLAPSMRPPPLSVDLSALSGVIEYQASEYTITAYGAALPIAGYRRGPETSKGQYLPLRPAAFPTAATIGGTVACQSFRITAFSLWWRARFYPGGTDRGWHADALFASAAKW